MAIICTDLRCERLVDPIGLDTKAPRLSWVLVADAGEQDVVQEGYRVEVRDRWDTDDVDSAAQQVTYAGPPLSSRERHQWRVRVRTSAGESPWSDWATFECGILDAAAWAATMITATAETPVVRFARSVEVPADAVSARLRLTAHGVVHATIDGAAVGDEVLAPGWTSYHHRLQVRTHDVSSLVVAGSSAEIALTVAPGWFSGRLGFGGGTRVYGEHVGAFAQLEIGRADGSLEVIGTDESWTASSTPYLQAELYDGETFDARLPDAGAPATVTRVGSFTPAVLCASPVPPVRRTQTLPVVARSGNVLDFGQNLVGWLRIRVHDLPVGTEIVLRHAEVLDADGALFTAPLRTASATDTFVTAGLPEETYEPRFTFHGFRYAEITGVDPGAVDVEAIVVHSDLRRTGTFSCSEPLLERLHQNVVWGLRGNFVSVPTDCPQRDERLGWTGDAQVFAPTASFLYDCESFWRNWLADVAADQGDDGGVPNVVPLVPFPHPIGPTAGWGDAAVVVPWATYVASGDDLVLRESLPTMAKWLDYVWSRLDAEHCWRHDFQFGDWLDPDAPIEQPWAAKARYDLVATACAARIATIVARAAAAVGDTDLEGLALDRAAVLRRSWWEHYGAEAGATQTAAAMAIVFELAPAEERPAVGEALVARVREAGDHLSTGFLGTPILLPALTALGRIDVAYDVLGQRTNPSWLYQVLAGATTVWERWDALRPDGSVPTGSLIGSDSSMVSFNHYAYGSVAEWMHATVAGLQPDPDRPGYRHVVVRPQPGGGITSAAATLQTPYGHTAVAWRATDEGDGIELDLDLPPNTTATVVLPGRQPVVVGSGVRTFR